MRKLRRSAARFVLIARKVRAKLFPPANPVPAAPAPTPSHEGGLRGKVVLITGSSRGIGLALAKAFLQAGARVVMTARTAPQLDTALREIADDESMAIAIAADLSSAGEAERLVSQAFERCGRVDVLINNAATPGPPHRAVWDVSASEWDAVWRLNVLAAASCAAALVRQARERRLPVRILNVSSGIVGHGAPSLGPYAMSKDALEGLTRALAADDSDGLVSAASIQPRSVRTDMTRAYYDGAMFALMDDAEVVAPVFLWAAGAPAAVVNGRSFSEPAFAASPAGAAALHGSMAGTAPIYLVPETFQPGARNHEAPGAYMHLLENAQGFYPAAAHALAHARPARSVWAYPDPTYRELREAIATEAGVGGQQIALGAGSSELIDRMLRLFCRPGDSIVITKPTWSFFHAFAQRWQLIATEVPMTGSMQEGSMRHDLNGLLDAITPRTRIVYLVNPCNPTGTVVPPAELEAFVRRLPGHVVAVIDEAYIQYAHPSVRPNVCAMIEDSAARLIVLRTFSKFFGLSGLRIGYAAASQESVGLLARAEIPFCINSPAVCAVPAVLADAAFRQKVFDDNQQGRQQLAEGLASLDISFQPSQTNFMLFECPTDPQRLRDDLRMRGLVLPNVDQFLRNYGVLAVGTPEHNAVLLEALGKY
ncbi:Histidinol-phosphate aminotransferase [Burkholderiaceae bacterium]|nr:Histidinol-phosphate aminotransferase [Burkholderiaceae bacterium]